MLAAQGTSRNWLRERQNLETLFLEFYGEVPLMTTFAVMRVYGAC
jgi:hypothetical protein